MNIILVGMNHKTASVAIRERLSLSCSNPNHMLQSFKYMPDIDELMHITTCNRFELLAQSDAPLKSIDQIKTFILENINLRPEELEETIYAYQNSEAVRHLLRVASGLDSMIMGEPQILGQIKDAYRQSVRNKTAGTILNKLLHHTFRVAKRVRTETAIAGNAVSVSYAAVELAKKIFGRLDGKTVLLVGAGNMAELAAKHLITSGIGKLCIVNRTYEKALQIAQEFHGEPFEFSALEKSLSDADIVISSTAAPGYIITPDIIKTALRRRKNRLIFLIDIAVPRNIDPAVGAITNAYLYDIDNLQDIVDQNMKSRLQEAIKAETIIAEETDIFSDWLNTLEVVPTIISLRKKIEMIAEVELERLDSWLKTLNSNDQEKLKILVSSIVKKVLHDPVTSLKEESQNGLTNVYVATVEKLFKLDDKRK